MDIVIGVVATIIGAFILFNISRFFFFRCIPNNGWMWVGLVLLLVILNFFIYKLIVPGVNLPFFTTLWFMLVTNGMVPKELTEEPTIKKWVRRGLIAMLIGMAIGWSLHSETCQISGGKTTCTPIFQIK